jgi:hypothetical protein
MENKVKVVNLVSGKVSLNIPDIRLNRTWEKKGAVKTIPYDQLEEALYDPGVEFLFREGILGMEDMETKIALGLEPEGAKEPVNIITLSDQQRKRYLTVMPIAEFRQEIKKLPIEQVKELGNFAIANEITSDFDKADIIKDMTGIDIVKTIELNRQDKAK